MALAVPSFSAEHPDLSHVGRVRSPAGLVGREHEITLLRQIIARGCRTSGSLVVRGEVGTGKSALLDVAEASASAQARLVLTGAGARTATGRACAPLHSLVQHVLDELHRVGASYRPVSSAASETPDGSPADPFVVGRALTELLVSAARRSPLVLIIDDAQDLDESSADVLTYVARRLSHEPIVILAAVTEEGGRVPPALLDLCALGELRLAGLDAESAAALVTMCAPALPPFQRAHVLSQSGGNPLAIVELTTSLRVSNDERSPLPTASEFRLGDRVTRRWSTKLATLPAPTQRVLLALSCEQDVSLAEAIGAVGPVGDELATLDAVRPALDAGLVAVDGPDVRFSHPLLRPVVYQRATVEDRHDVHLAICNVVWSDRFRRAWHHALAISGRDDEVAAELHDAAETAFVEGRMVKALVAFERAAWLTSDETARRRSIHAAAEAASELGWSDFRRAVASSNEGMVDPSLLSPVASAGYRPHDHHGGAGDAWKFLARARFDGRPRTARRWILRAVIASEWAEPDSHFRRDVLDLVDELGLDDMDPWRLAVLATAGSAQDRTIVAHAIGRIEPHDIENADASFAAGVAAGALCQWDPAAVFLSRAIDIFRAQGRVVILTQALTLRAAAALRMSRMDQASSDADEAARLASSTDQPLWRARALAILALRAAMNGDDEGTERISSTADRHAMPLRASVAVADVYMARGHSALAHGCHLEAARTLSRLFVGPDRAGTDAQRLCGIGDFVEASVRGGDRWAAADAVAALVQVMPAGVLERSGEFALAGALLSDDTGAERDFVAALEQATAWAPFVQARIALAYGVVLRRSRRAADSRRPLETAATTFEALGARPWAQRARQELRATGAHRRRGPASFVELTEQEVVVAQMAASGLSNKQIGQRLYLSHRTVGAHLYRIFPKLGIVSRGELHQALAAADISAPSA